MIVARDCHVVCVVWGGIPLLRYCRKQKTENIKCCKTKEWKKKRKVCARAPPDFTIFNLNIIDQAEAVWYTPACRMRIAMIQWIVHVNTLYSHWCCLLCVCDRRFWYFYTSSHSRTTENHTLSHLIQMIFFSTARNDFRHLAHHDAAF